MSRTAWRHTVGHVIASVAIAVIGAAGVINLGNPDEFARSLVSWGIDDRDLQRVISVVVPSLEVVIALAWFIGVFRAGAIIAATVFLVGVTSAYVWLWAMGHPPECSCFGALANFRQTRSSAPWIVAMNVVLIIALVVAWTTLWRAMRSAQSRMIGVRSRSDAPASESIAHAARTSDLRAFTLLETILVIAIVGILVSMSVPLLGSFKRDAAAIKALSELGSNSKLLLNYTTEHRDFMPAFTDPKATFTVIYVDDNPVKLVYFDTYDRWHYVLADRSFNMQRSSPAFSEYYHAGSGWSSYWYSLAFQADPAFWKYETRIGPEQWRATRLSEVVFPSQKAVLFGSRFWNGFGKVKGDKSEALLAFCDASAAVIPERNLVVGYLNGTGTWPGSTLVTWYPGMVTIDGVRGRDR
jgi:prepilin-type N-terminal cleavage/methylation domain-containing protein